MSELDQARFDEIERMSNEQRQVECLKHPEDFAQWAGIKRMQMKAAHQAELLETIANPFKEP